MNPLKIMEVSKVLQNYAPEFIEFLAYLDSGFLTIAHGILGSVDIEIENENEFSMVENKAGLELLKRVKKFKEVSAVVLEAIETLKPKE